MSYDDLRSVRHTLTAAARTFVPEIADLDDDDWRVVECDIERLFLQRTPEVRRQVVLFLTALEFLAVLRFGRPFSHLALDSRTRFLESLQRSSMVAVRRGVWGIRTMVLVAWYTQPATTFAIGYAPQFDGWTLRRPVSTPITSTDGESANGAPANGAPANGAPANGSLANDNPANDNPVNDNPAHHAP
ncbi:MAG TPA: hypothetical protein VFG84_02030 [Gemmatimonadaceae bacterium]|nr:hypothetical protein [Gemmatimonadaceae bacterium]